MKRFRLLAVLGALALCTATVVWGDYNVLDKSTHYQNAPTGLRVNSTGDLRVDDMARDRDNWRIYPNVINNNLINTATGLMDSSQVQDTHDIRKMSLVLYGQFDSLSTVVRLAVQIRGHYNTATDSGSAYPWYRWPLRTPQTTIPVSGVLGINGSAVLHTAAAAASLGAFTAVPIGYLAIGNGIPVGAYVVSKGTSDSALTVSVNLSQPLNGTVTFAPPGSVIANGSTGFSDVDSLGHMFRGSDALAQVTAANAPFPNSTGIWPGEFVVKFSMANSDSVQSGAGKYGGYPKGMWIPLVDAVGVPFQAPYTSVRVRILNGVRSRFKLRADLVGQSQ